MTDEEAALILESRACYRRTMEECRCAEGVCAAFDANDDTKYWVRMAWEVNTPLPALAALATDEAVVVPRKLTAAMADRVHREQVAYISSEEIDAIWTAALDASSFKREAE